MRTSRVEVTQQSAVPLVRLSLVARLGRVVALGVDHVRDGVLNGEFGVAVRIGRAQWAVFGDWDHIREAGGIAVDGGRAGEDDVGDVVTHHGP